MLDTPLSETIQYLDLLAPPGQANSDNVELELRRLAQSINLDVYGLTQAQMSCLIRNHLLQRSTK